MSLPRENGSVGQSYDQGASLDLESLLQSDDLKKAVSHLIQSQLLSSSGPRMMGGGFVVPQLSDLLNQRSSLIQKVIPINDLRGDEGSVYNREEKQMRCNLAALYRLMDLQGWIYLIYNHISVRVAPDADIFLVNPFGLLYREITASSLVKINIEGDIIDRGSTVLGVNKAGWNLHSALHAARKDVFCVIHHHLPDVVAVASTKCGLLPVSPEAIELLEDVGVAYHDYEGIFVNEAERVTLAADLGTKAKILFLRNHGAAVCARNVAEAWVLNKRLVVACQTQMRLLQLGGSKMVAELVADLETGAHGRVRGRLRGGLAQCADAQEQGEEGGQPDAWGHNEMEFEAMMRHLDSAGYRTGYTYKQPNLFRRTTQQTPGTMTAGQNVWSNGGPVDGVDSLVHQPQFSDVEVDEQAQGRIANQLRASRQKAAQRNQWLAKVAGPPTAGAGDRTDSDA